MLHYKETFILEAQKTHPIKFVYNYIEVMSKYTDGINADAQLKLRIETYF